MPDFLNPNSNAPKKFFVPVQALSKIFRAKFVERLDQAFNKQMLIIPQKDCLLYGNLKRFEEMVYGKLWHVHIKKTFKGAGQVISYLGRYTHRVAISNSRLLSMCNNVIRFRWNRLSGQSTENYGVRYTLLYQTFSSGHIAMMAIIRSGIMEYLQQCIPKQAWFNALLCLALHLVYRNMKDFQCQRCYSG
jgi:hypothetical protein